MTATATATATSLDYIANDPSSNGSEFAEYMQANFDYCLEDDGHKACVRKYNAHNRTCFSAWHEVAIHLFSIEESLRVDCQLQSFEVGVFSGAKIEATASILAATEKSVVLGLLAECKTDEEATKVALAHSEKFAEFKNDPSNFRGVKSMIHELHTLGFSVEQIYSLKIYDKEKSLAIMSIKDAIRKASKGLGINAPALTTARKVARSNKVKSVIETSADIEFKISQCETMLASLKFRHAELLNAEEAAALLERAANREAAIKALLKVGISLEVAEGILAREVF